MTRSRVSKGLVVARATTGPYQMDTMDEVPNATARQRFIGFYLDVSHNLPKVRVPAL